MCTLDLCSLCSFGYTALAEWQQGFPSFWFQNNVNGEFIITPLMLPLLKPTSFFFINVDSVCPSPSVVACIMFMTHCILWLP